MQPGSGHRGSQYEPEVGDKSADDRRAKPRSIITTVAWPGYEKRRRDRFSSIELQIVAFATRVVASRRAAVRTATMLGLPGEDALELPIALIGTPDELCERLLERRERWGFTNIVVPGEAMESFAPVVARLAGT